MPTSPITQTTTTTAPSLSKTTKLPSPIPVIPLSTVEMSPTPLLQPRPPQQPQQPQQQQQEQTDEELLLSLAGGGLSSSASGNLQGSFAKFRQERSRIKKLEKQNSKSKPPKTTEEKASLRALFIAQAKQYLGVPYHPSYHTDEESEHFEAPLYLDCCGLTRRCLQDLSSSFGFIIGPGNQAYQYDTLSSPDNIREKIEDCAPGDIIFTEGVFFKEGKKQQKFNMVHVEIYLGLNPSTNLHETIGARKQTGVVEILPSYIFESKGYEITKFHFRSLERWLDGVVDPVIDKAFWDLKFGKKRDGASDGKSVFDADDDDDDDDEDVAAGASNSATITIDKTTTSAAYNGKKFYVNKSNGWQLVSNSLEAKGWTRLPFASTFTNAYNLKWVEGRSKINFATHKTGQLVNHISNNDVICNKIGLISCLQEQYGASYPPGYFPMTYRLDRPSDAMALMKESEKLADKVWIYKPSGKNCGKGIQVVSSTSIKDIVYKKQGLDNGEMCFDGSASTSVNSNTREKGLNSPTKASKANADGVIQSRYSSFVLQNGLVQSYIMNPLLLNGKKFDIRVYCLISRTAPHAIVYYHPGYCRLTLEDFNVEESQLGNNLIHLTNAAIQKKHPEYKDKKDNQIWSMNALAAYCLENKLCKQKTAADFTKDIDDKLCAVILDVWKSSESKLKKKFGYFDLLGFDFMIDTDFKVKLLEVNTNPAMHLDCKVHEDLLPQLISSTLTAVIESHTRIDGTKDDEEPLKNVSVRSGRELSKNGLVDEKFVLLVDEQSNFEWNGEGSKDGRSVSGAGAKAVKELSKNV